MISIITPTLNSEQTIGTCLRSVHSQIPVEHVVVDGGSTDRTVEIAKGFSKAVRIVSGPDNGIYDALNKGIALSEGEVIGILNANDFYPHPSCLRRVEALFADPEIDACYGDLVYVDQDDPTRIFRYWRTRQHSLRDFYYGWMPPHPTFFCRRRVYEQYGGFRLDLGSAADYELMLRFLLKHAVKAKHIPEVLVCMRRGGMSNRSLSGRLEANRMDRKAWKVNYLKPLPFTTLIKPLRKILQYFQRTVPGFEIDPSFIVQGGFAQGEYDIAYDAGRMHSDERDEAQGARQ